MKFYPVRILAWERAQINQCIQPNAPQGLCGDTHSCRYVSGRYLSGFCSYGVRLSPLGTAATVWPIVPATDQMMMMIVEQSVKCELTGETETLGENLPQCHFVHYKSHMR
jgi:hypothetical protein